MRHVARMNASCHTQESVMSRPECVTPHIWINHVTPLTCHAHPSHRDMDEFCHSYACVTLHIWMRDVTLLNESCHTCKCVLLNTSMSHVTHCMSHTWHIYKVHTSWILLKLYWGILLAQEFSQKWFKEYAPSIEPENRQLPPRLAIKGNM